MKKSGIHITNTELIFTAFPSKEIGLAMYCKSFNIDVKNIQLIAISPRLALDDEALFILIIDKFFKIHKIPYAYNLTKFLNFEDHFDLNISKEWERFEYEDHYGKVDKVIYPEKNYWFDLFENDWKLKIRAVYSWTKPKSFFGNFNKKLLS